MQASEVRTAGDASRIVEQRELSHVKVGVFDIDGILRGKYMSREKFFSALDKGFGFCDVVLGWDSQDQLYDNVSYTGWHTGYPDALVRIIPENCRARSGRPRRHSRARRWRGNGSATPSWITTPPPGNGRSANSASTSRTGRWTGILRLSKS